MNRYRCHQCRGEIEGMGLVRGGRRLHPDCARQEPRERPTPAPGPRPEPKPKPEAPYVPRRKPSGRTPRRGAGVNLAGPSPFAAIDQHRATRARLAKATKAKGGAA